MVCVANLMPVFLCLLSLSLGLLLCLSVVVPVVADATVSASTAVSAVTRSSSGVGAKTNTSDAPRNYTDFHRLVELVSKFESADLLKVGQVLFMNKVSEILMPEEIHDAMGFDPRYWEEEQFTAHPAALALLSTGPFLPLSQFTPLYTSRLRTFGAVAVPSVLSRAFCDELNHAIDRELRECVVVAVIVVVGAPFFHA